MAWRDQQGYVRVWHQGRETREHRVVAEQLLGRPLQRWEHVHHRNEVKDDNRPENLEVIDSRSHTAMHWDEGLFDRRVERQTKPAAACSGCGWFGRLQAKGMCKKCYYQDYYRQHPEKWRRG